MGLMSYFSPQYGSSKQTAVQNPSMDTLFTRILSIWRRKHTAHCWESWGWTQTPRLSLIPIVPASYPLSTSSIRGSCGVTFQVTTEGKS